MKLQITFTLAAMCAVTNIASAKPKESAKPKAFTYSYPKDFLYAKVKPMLLLLRTAKANPKQNNFIIDFHAETPMSVCKTKVNFDRKSKKLFLKYDSGDGWKSLILFHNVTLDTISKIYHVSQKVGYQSGQDNFEQLEQYCPQNVLLSKKGFSRP